MAGAGYLAMAALILFLLPVVVLPWEGRRVPDALYALIAAVGMIAAGIEGGMGAVLIAGAVGIACFAAVTGIVTALRIMLRLQILTGSHIKLLAAGSIWLGITGTLAMLAIAFGTLFLIAAAQQLMPATRRPDFPVIAALAILCVGIQQAVPAHEVAQAVGSKAGGGSDR